MLTVFGSQSYCTYPQEILENPTVSSPSSPSDELQVRGAGWQLGVQLSHEISPRTHQDTIYTP
jgi:hypothetical protein